MQQYTRERYSVCWSSTTNGKDVLKKDIALDFANEFAALPPSKNQKKENKLKAYPAVHFQQPFLSARCNI